MSDAMRLWSALGATVAASEAAAESHAPRTEQERSNPVSETHTAATAAANGTKASIDTVAYRELGETVQPIARSIDKLLKEAEKLEESDTALADLGLDLKSALVAYESHIVRKRRGKA